MKICVRDTGHFRFSFVIPFIPSYPGIDEVVMLSRFRARRNSFSIGRHRRSCFLGSMRTNDFLSPSHRTFRRRIVSLQFHTDHATSTNSNGSDEEQREKIHHELNSFELNLNRSAWTLPTDSGLSSNDRGARILDNSSIRCIDVFEPF